MVETKKCGNCPHFNPDDKILKELKENKNVFIYRGKCSINGKKMNAELKGCPMWK
jgi:hypothetical protein